MSKNSTAATVVTVVPSEALTEAHRLALFEVGFVVEAEGEGKVHLFAPPEEGPGLLDLAMLQPFDDTWLEWLEETGLAAHTGETFVADLYDHAGAGPIDWTDMLQLVLRDLPDTVPHLDVTVSAWSEPPTRGAFWGTAVRITREAIYAQESPSDFFAQVTARQRMAGEVAKDREGN